MSIALSSLSSHPSYPVRLFAEDLAQLKKSDQQGTDQDPRENFIQTTGVETYAEGKPTFTTQFILGGSDGHWSLKSRCLDQNGEVSWVRIRSLDMPDPGQSEQVTLHQEAVSVGPSADRSYCSKQTPTGDSFARIADPPARLQELNEQFAQEWNFAQ